MSSFTQITVAARSFSPPSRVFNVLISPQPQVRRLVSWLSQSSKQVMYRRGLGLVARFQTLKQHPTTCWTTGSRRTLLHHESVKSFLSQPALVTPRRIPKRHRSNLFDATSKEPVPWILLGTDITNLGVSAGTCSSGLVRQSINGETAAMVRRFLPHLELINLTS